MFGYLDMVRQQKIAMQQANVEYQRALLDFQRGQSKDYIDAEYEIIEQPKLLESPE